MHAGKFMGRTGTLISIAETAVALKQHDYIAAAQRGTVTVAGATLQSEKAMKLAAKLASKLAPSIIRGGAEEIPLIGAVAASGFAVWDIGTTVAGAIKGENSWKKVGTTTAANIAEIGGGLVGFGGGQAARQIVVESSRKTLGEANAPQDAAIVSLGKEVYGAVRSAQDAEPTLSAVPPPATRGRGGAVLRNAQGKAETKQAIAATPKALRQKTETAGKRPAFPMFTS